MQEDIKSQKIGYLLAQEWIFLNSFLWVGALAGVAIAFFTAPESWDRDEFWHTLNIAVPALTSIPYLLFIYFRSLRTAWRIKTGKIAPPDITPEDIKSLNEAAVTATGK